DCLPRVGDTVSTLSRFRSTGRAPWFRTSARSLAFCSLKLPVIWPVPLQIGDWTEGAEMVSRSSVMASSFIGGLCVWSCVVTPQNRLEPLFVRSNWMSQPTGVPEVACVLYTAVDLAMASPVIFTGPSLLRWQESNEVQGCCVSGLPR